MQKTSTYVSVCVTRVYVTKAVKTNHLFSSFRSSLGPKWDTFATVGKGGIWALMVMLLKKIRVEHGRSDRIERQGRIRWQVQYSSGSHKEQV